MVISIFLNIADLMDIVDNLCCVNNALYNKLTRTQANLSQIRELISQWSNDPLFLRHEGNGLLHDSDWDTNHIVSVVNKRYFVTLQVYKDH